jgi:hypothetical protein
MYTERDYQLSSYNQYSSHTQKIFQQVARTCPELISAIQEIHSDEDLSVEEFVAAFERLYDRWYELVSPSKIPSVVNDPGLLVEDGGYALLWAATL